MDRARQRLIGGPAWVVGGIAAAIRLVWVFLAARTPAGLSDPILYWGSANSIANGDGYRSIKGTLTSYYPPGYPYFLAGVQRALRSVGLEEHLAVGVGVAQALLGGIAAAAIVVAGTRLGRQFETAPGARPGRPAPTATAIGVSAGLVLALWPNLIVYSAAVLSETLFIAVFAVFLAAVLTMEDGRGPTLPGGSGRDGAAIRPGRAVVAGLSLGIATLVRPQVLLVAGALFLAWVVGRVGWRSLLERAAVLAVGVVVVVTPWVVRNAGVFDSLVPVSTNGGDNLCVGFHDDAPGYFTIPATCNTGEFYTDGPEAELRRNRETRAMAVDWITSNVGELPALSIKKLWYTYRSDTDGLRAVESYEADPFLGAWRSPLRFVSTAGYLLIMAATLVGLVMVAVRGWRDRRSDVTALAVLAVTVASFVVPVLVFGDPRFKLPAAPCYALLAGLAIVTLVDRVRRFGHHPSVPPIPPIAMAPGDGDDGEAQDRPAMPSS